MATSDILTYIISADKEPRANNKAGATPSEMDICIAAIFNDPNGKEPRKEMKSPVTNIRMSLDMPVVKGIENIAFS
jgi:hypothetical protein